MAKISNTFKFKPLPNKTQKRKRKTINTKYSWKNQPKTSKIKKKLKWKEDAQPDKKYLQVLSSDSHLLKFFVEVQEF